MAIKPDGDAPPSVFAVLLAGGSGTRLWPVSRELYPKQLVRFIGDRSLVQSTIRRLSPVLHNDHIRVVCGQEHYHETARHMEQIGLDPAGRILVEPCGRNTAPAILLAVLSILREAADPVVFIFPADHVIRDIPGFHRKLRQAVSLAQAGYIVTFGIQPHYPETGYGYIEGGAMVDGGARRLERFVEKPDETTAREYLSAGNYFWNSGMFAFRASVIEAEFQKNEPDMYRRLDRRIESGRPLTREFYRQLKDISIDYAIMEKTRNGVVLPSDFGWSDIGSWKSLYDFLPKDENQNVLDGDVMARNTKESFVVSYERLIATNHLERMVVIETPDSIFVSDLDRSRDVKTIVEQLKKAGRKESRHHRTQFFSWGRETLIEQRRGYRVRRMVVYPGLAMTADALDDACSRHWCIVSGGCRIKFPPPRKVKVLSVGDAFSPPARIAISVENHAPEPLHIIETQTGG